MRSLRWHHALRHVSSGSTTRYVGGRSFAASKVSAIIEQDNLAEEVTQHSLDANIAAYEQRDKRQASARKAQATRQARKAATDRAASSPPRIGTTALEPHNDLPSYLEHAARKSVKTTTTVYKGTVYEYTVAAALKQYGMDLKRVGKANDYGIDLIGSWTLPEGRTLRIFLQCKLTKATPAYIREIEGAYTGAPAGWDTDEVLAILATRHPATAGTQLAIQRSTSPLGIVQVDTTGSIKQFLWNHVATEVGLAEVGVTSKHSAGSKTKDEDSTDIALTWQSRRWPTQR